jgi:4-amino-4-deoxy-L-arabinose transferase-like glycosyltransferase
VAATGPAEAAPIWRYRLPSLCAAVLAAVLTARIAQLFGGARAGLLAGLCMAGMFVLGAEARLAKTDAVVGLTVLAAQLPLARLWLGTGQGRAPGLRLGLWPAALFWAATATGLLVKGPVGLLFVALTAAVLSVRARGVRWLLGLRPLAGLALVLVLVVPWYVAITLKAGHAFWDEALGRDLLGKVAQGQEGHGALPGFYALTGWLTFFPASVALALCLPAIWRGRAAAGIVFALAWFVPGWLVFEAISTKLLHYTLPALPGLALAVALVWDRVLREPLPRWAGGLALAVALLPVAGLAALAVQAIAPVPRMPLATGFAGLALGMLVFDRARRRACGAVALAGLWLAGAAFQGAVVHSLARTPSLFPAPAVVALARDAACPAPELFVAGYAEASVVFLSPGPVRFVPAATAMAALAGGGCVRAVVPADTAAEGRLLGRVQGINLGTGQPLDLAVYAP